MKQKHKIFKAAVIAAMLVLLCCVTVVFAAEAKGTPGLGIIGHGSGSYSPVAPDLLVRCMDEIFDEDGEKIEDGHGEISVELDEFMCSLQYKLPKLDITNQAGEVIGETEDYSFAGFAKAYYDVYGTDAAGLNYGKLFENLAWVDQGNNQSALKISPDGVTALIDYYNKLHESQGIPVHSLLKTSEGAIAEHNCTKDSTSLNYFSCIGYTPATCTKDGTQASWCKECGKIFEDVVIPATGHKIQTVTLQEATCTEPGIKVSYCANPWCDKKDECGSIDQPKVTFIPAKGHDFDFAADTTASHVQMFHYHFGDLQTYVAPCAHCGKLDVRTVSDADRYGFNRCSICSSGSAGSQNPYHSFTMEDAAKYMGNDANWIGGKIPSGVPMPSVPSAAAEDITDDEENVPDEFAPMPDETEKVDEATGEPAEETQETDGETQEVIVQANKANMTNAVQSSDEIQKAAKALAQETQKGTEPAVLALTTFDGTSIPCIVEGDVIDELVPMLVEYLNNKKAYSFTQVAYKYESESYPQTGTYNEMTETDETAVIDYFDAMGYKSDQNSEDPNGHGWLYGCDYEHYDSYYGTTQIGTQQPAWIFSKIDENGNVVPDTSATSASIVVDVISEGYTVSWYDADTGELITGKDPEVRQVEFADKETKKDVSVSEKDKADFTVRGQHYTFVPDDNRNVTDGTAEWNKEPLALKLYFKKDGAFTVKYEWSGLPDNATETLPAGGSYAKDTEVSVDTKYTSTTEITVDGKTYVFSGWSTTDATVTDGKFTMPEKDVTLSGIWKEKNTDPENPTPTPPTPITPVTPTPPTPPTDIDDPDTPLGPGPNDPAVDIDEPDTPLAPASDEPAEEIDEEEPPLADAPKTGDDFQIWTWIALVMTSGAGLAWLVLADRKRKNAVK